MRGKRGDILILDDDEMIHRQFKEDIIFHDLHDAYSLNEAGQKLRKLNIDLAIVDLDLLGDNRIDMGLDYIKKIRRRYPAMAVMVLSSHKAIATVVKAVQNGADDYEAKGNLKTYHKDFWNRINDLVQLKRSREKKYLKVEADIVAASPEITMIKDRLQLIAENKEPFFLIGQTGIDKKQYVNFVYMHGYNLDDLQEPIFEDLSLWENEEILNVLRGEYIGKSRDILRKANKSILFIDRLETKPLEIQRAFLSVMTDNSYLNNSRALDIQFIFGLAQGVQDLLEQGLLSRDLVNNLKQVKVPPLSKRRGDIDVIIDDWLQTKELPANAMAWDIRRRFGQYAFPGNEGELFNILDRMLANHQAEFGVSHTSIPIGWRSVPAEILERGEDLGNLKFDIARVELSYIDNALRMHKGVIKDAAKALSVSFQKSWNKDNLRYRIKKYKETYPDLISQYPMIVECYNL